MIGTLERPAADLAMPVVTWRCPGGPLGRLPCAGDAPEETATDDLLVTVNRRFTAPASVSAIGGEPARRL